MTTATAMLINHDSSHGTYRANVRGCVQAELAMHGATEGEIAAVEQQVLYRLSQLGEKTTL